MSRRYGEVLLGAALLLLLVVALPFGVERAGSSEGMHLELHGRRPYQLAAEGAPAERVSFGPEALVERLQQQGERDHGGPGLAFRSWQLSYGSRWQRRIDVPMLQGPFETDSEVWSYGMLARIRPGVFDPRRGGDGLQQLAKERLNAVLPLRFACGPKTDITLEKAGDVELRLIPRDGHIRVGLIATLADGTKIGARTRIRLRRNGDRLAAATTGPIEPVFAGPQRDKCEGSATVSLANLVEWLLRDEESLVDTVARQHIAQHLAPVIAELNEALGKLHEPFAIFERRPQDRISLRLAADPITAADGIYLPLRPQVTLAEPKVDATIGGPPIVEAAAPELNDPAAPQQARIDLVANAQGINQLLFLLWQTGELRSYGTSSQLLDALPDDVRALAFEVTGFDPQLPPVVRRAGGGAVVRFANVALGDWGERHVLAHADVRAMVRSADGHVTIGGDIELPRVQCARRSRAQRWRLTPCLSELMPLLADRLQDATPSFDVDPSPLLAALSRHSLHGLAVRVSDLRSATQSRPLTLQASVAVRIVAPKR